MRANDFNTNILRYSQLAHLSSYFRPQIQRPTRLSSIPKRRFNADFNIYILPFWNKLINEGRWRAYRHLLIDNNIILYAALGLQVDHQMRLYFTATGFYGGSVTDLYLINSTGCLPYAFIIRNYSFVSYTSTSLYLKTWCAALRKQRPIMQPIMAAIGSSVVIIKWYLMTLTPHLILNDDDDEERQWLDPINSVTSHRISSSTKQSIVVT